MEPKFESFDQWVNKQFWSDADKDEAREIDREQTRLGLNPWTWGQWLSWTKAKGIVIVR